jgi:uncharacterized protein (TIGR02588 family)
VAQGGKQLQALDRRRESDRQSTPPLEWLASGIGLVLTLGMLGLIGWQAYRGTEAPPPTITVVAERIVQTGSGFVVEVIARNRSPTTAAAVEIEGELKQGGQTVATSKAILDYVPGNSERRGGLFFKEDPRPYQLELRPLGYAEP